LYLPKRATYLPKRATYLPKRATYLPKRATTRVRPYILRGYPKRFCGFRVLSRFS